MSQNDVTTQNVQVTYGSSTRVFDGWVQYWSDTCNGITTYTWPGSYGDVYLKDDGYLYDSSSKLILSQFYSPKTSYSVIANHVVYNRY